MTNSRSLKTLCKPETWQVAFFTFLSIILGNAAFAQTTVPEKVEVDINAGGDGGGAGWYAQPWVWAIGVAIFIIIIIAITRGGSSRREV